jgi:putative endonuclease
MFYVYILKSSRDGKLYIGYSSNLKQRIKQHCNGEVESTKHRRPLELVYYEGYKNEEDARLREKSFKKSGSVYNGLVKRIKKSIDEGA